MDIRRRGRQNTKKPNDSNTKLWERRVYMRRKENTWIEEGTKKGTLENYIQQGIPMLSLNDKNKEYSIFLYQSSQYTLFYSTLQEDERNCLYRIICKLDIQQKKVTSRTGVKDTFLMPLLLLGDFFGYCVLEDRKHAIHLSTLQLNHLRILGFYIGAFMQKQVSTYQSYCDTVTKLPGRQLLHNVIKELGKRGESYLLCAIRLCAYEQIQKKQGESNTDILVQLFADQLRFSHIGAEYGYDQKTFVLLSKKEVSELLDQMCLFSSECRHFSVSVIVVDGPILNMDWILSKLDKEELGCKYIENYQKLNRNGVIMHYNTSKEDNDFLKWLGGLTT